MCMLKEIALVAVTQQEDVTQQVYNIFALQS